MSELLLCASETAAENLRKESAHGKIEVVGDVMVDLAYRWREDGAADSEPLKRVGVVPRAYILLTAHRAGNVDDPERLAALVGIVGSLQEPVVFPVHPRTRARLQAAGLWERLEALEGVQLCEPLGYVEFGTLLRGARAVLTDSGGVQKEAYLAGVRCVTLRANTEWVETVQAGWNTLVDLDMGRVREALAQPVPRDRPALYGDGKAAERCVAAIGML
jgi:UDP-N-acetylglucosamine 2-epimerase (non-hydrolysing)/UDP-GlcNAc3NAcA epimerase